MPPERRGPGDPTEWLRRARSNLARAQADRDLPEVLYEDLCFDAQQAAEKSLKAVLVYHRVGFPKTHDINALLGLLRASGMDLPDELRQADALTGYAVDIRYPGLTEPVTREELEQAIELAKRVLHWAEALILGTAE
ncbi:MAG: HEPN domain-containing protein [Acidobacteria bacterium]|nr:HEPN domain-containing protein [Acidobacteriota bacterium]